MKRRIRYAPPKGPVAISPKAWGEDFDALIFGGASEPEPLFTAQGPYAVVEICGPLSQRAAFFSDSYEDIHRRAAAAFGSEASAVCLRIDSPGGDWCGALELARDLRAMAKAAGKRLVAFTDGQALSAGYALACAAETIVATESASVGSIGVWQALVDVTAQDAMMGVKVAIAASGAAKAERNPHAGITDEAFARMVAQVEEQASIFFEHVSVARTLPVSRVKALEGAELFGQRALAAGLTDRIVNSWSAFLSEKDTPMPSKASKYDEAYGLLKQAAEGEDEEAAKKAKKALKAMEDEGEEKKDDKEAKAKAEEEEKAKKAKAEDEEKKKKDDEQAKAKALSDPLPADTLALAAEVHAMKAERAAEKEEAERGTLLAKRPDFSAEIRATLAKASLEQLREAVEKWPRIGAPPIARGAAASQALGTRAPHEDAPDAGPRGDDDFIARRMGAFVDGTGIKSSGRNLELGTMTPVEAKAWLASAAGQRAQALVQKGQE